MGNASANVNDRLAAADAAVDAIDRLYKIGREKIRAKVVKDGKLDGELLEREQLAAHALAYVATELFACRQLVAWAKSHPTTETEAIARAFVAEVARGLRSVVWLGATETYPVTDMHVTEADVEETVGLPKIARWADDESSGEAYLALAKAQAAGTNVPA